MQNADTADRADGQGRSLEAMIRPDHFAVAFSTARCSVSPEDVKKYRKFAETLPQSRGMGSP